MEKSGIVWENNNSIDRKFVLLLGPTQFVGSHFSFGNFGKLKFVLLRGSILVDKRTWVGASSKFVLFWVRSRNREFKKVFFVNNYFFNDFQVYVEFRKQLLKKFNFYIQI